MGVRGWALLSVAACTLVLVTVYMTRRVLRTGDTVEAVGAIDESEISRELQVLRGRIARMERSESLRRIAGAQTDEPAEAFDNEAHPQPNKDQHKRRRLSPEERKERVQAIREGLTRYIASEDRDEVWAGEVASQIAETFRSAELNGATLLDSQCGKSVCSARFHFAGRRGSQPYEDMQEKLLRSAPFDGSSLFVPVGDGEYEIYFTRAGEALPPLGLDSPT